LLEGNPGAASEQLGQLMEAEPESTQVKYLLVDALLRTGEVNRATELLEQLVVSEPVQSPARQMLAALWMDRGRPDRVIELLGEGGSVQAAGASSELLAAARESRAHTERAVANLVRKLD